MNKIKDVTEYGGFLPTFVVRYKSGNKKDIFKCEIEDLPTYVQEYMLKCTEDDNFVVNCLEGVDSIIFSEEIDRWYAE